LKDSQLNAALTKNAIAVLERRYLFRDEAGNITETPEALFCRVANFVAQGDAVYGATQEAVEKTAETFYQLLASLAFLPNSPTLMNAGRKNAQLSACFVLPIQDTLESIFESLKHAALIHQSGGGTGFSFSHLRPKNDVVRSTMGVSSGPVSFLKVYNAATDAIKQGGTRRGANMGILRVDHPDILEFIHCKQDLSQVTNFNLSVGITNDFMSALETKGDFSLTHAHQLKDHHQSIPAQELFDAILNCAWQTGEPGLIFLDTINRDNPTPHLGPIESTNPCGEVPLLAYEACNLGSIHLGKLLKPNEKEFQKENDSDFEIDWELLAQTTRTVTHFLDNVITQNHFPIEAIKAMVEENRKIGIGVMGWADVLIALKIPYASQAALQLAQDVMSFIDYHSKLASVELAKTRGPFPACHQSRFTEQNWLSGKRKRMISKTVKPEQWDDLEKSIQQHGLRNATTTCIAPTGTISIIAGASGGIEPLFGVVFFRNIMDGTEMVEYHPGFQAWAESHHLSETDLRQIAAHGSLKGLETIPDHIQKRFQTAHDVSPEWHVRMQAAFQQFTDNGVSKTINFPESATIEDIAKTYRLAYTLGTKGITVYRNNSRQAQPMSHTKVSHSLEHQEKTASPIPLTQALDAIPPQLDQCPECGTKMDPGEGCQICPTCAYSPCL
jgi:ribonucleoside-diphosphate reductase alpha chain